jgi:hypothetical protein
MSTSNIQRQYKRTIDANDFEAFKHLCITSDELISTGNIERLMEYKNVFLWVDVICTYQPKAFQDMFDCEFWFIPPLCTSRYFELFHRHGIIVKFYNRTNNMMYLCGLRDHSLIMMAFTMFITPQKQITSIMEEDNVLDLLYGIDHRYDERIYRRRMPTQCEPYHDLILYCISHGYLKDHIDTCLTEFLLCNTSRLKGKLNFHCKEQREALAIYAQSESFGNRDREFQQYLVDGIAAYHIYMEKLLLATNDALESILGKDVVKHVIIGYV